MAQSKNEEESKDKKEETKILDTSKPKSGNTQVPKEEQTTELDEQQKAEEKEFEKYGDELLNKMIVEDDGSYLAEYNDVIAQISGICALLAANQKAGKNKHIVNEFQVVELCPRINALSTEYRQLNEEEKKKVFLETLLKGCFSLLAIKSPVVALKISNCNINCFFKIFDRVISREKIKAQDQSEIDFKKVFNYLFETVRGLLIYAKEGKFDQMFMEEGLIPQLCYVISKCFIEHGNPLLCDLLSSEVAGKTVRNDEKVLDLLNYTIGTIKCFT